LVDFDDLEYDFVSSTYNQAAKKLDNRPQSRRSTALRVDQLPVFLRLVWEKMIGYFPDLTNTKGSARVSQPTAADPTICMHYIITNSHRRANRSQSLRAPPETHWEPPAANLPTTGIDCRGWSSCLPMRLDVSFILVKSQLIHMKGAWRVRDP
jgi:hypothetical protein